MLTNAAHRPLCHRRYLLLCAPGSVVQQCVDQPPLRELRPPMQYYSAVQQLCNATSAAAAAPAAGDAAAAPGGDRVGAAGGDRVGVAATVGTIADRTAAPLASASVEGGATPGQQAACAACSAMSASPDKVVVQALQANCPNPLGECLVYSSWLVQPPA